MSYGGYLDLERLLSAQHPRSTPEHHDELLFIVQHQQRAVAQAGPARAARRPQYLHDDELAPALKCLARVKNIQRTLTEQWSVLATLTPRETPSSAAPSAPRRASSRTSTGPSNSSSATRTPPC